MKKLFVKVIKWSTVGGLLGLTYGLGVVHGMDYLIQKERHNRA